MIGMTFGRLVAVERVESLAGHAKWRCVCACGNVVVVLAGHLRSGHTKSCGCVRRETAEKRNRESAKHGKTKTPEFRIWSGIKTRCYNAADPAFPRYGGRGIVMCERWRTDFAAFLADMGTAPGADYSIDRIDNDGPYSPDNCRWATRSEQGRNKRSNRLFEYEGALRPLVEIAEKCGMAPETIAMRMKRGWSFEKATSTPVIETARWAHKRAPRAS